MPLPRITIDLSQSKLFSVSCKCVEMLEDLRYRGYKVDLIANQWSRKNKKKGLTFNSLSGEYDQGESRFLWDPKVHPIDYYENLIVPTFKNIRYIKKKKESRFYALNIIKKIFNIFNPLYFSEVDFVPRYAEKHEKIRYHQQHIDMLLKNLSIKHFLNYIVDFIKLNITNRFKIISDSRGFRYKLNPILLDNNVKNFIKTEKEKCTKYVLVSGNWDDEKKYEKQIDRLRGIISNENEFRAMQEYVKDLDKYALEGSIRIILASKKACDWDKIIKSDFLDLREFEKKGFTLSQTIYIIQELTNMTINWPNTFCIWITNCSGILHLTWCDNKDTSKWSRNNIKNEPVENALRLIGIRRKTNQ